jgi:glutathione S-transferase
MSYVIGTIHGQGYTRIFTTDSYTSDPAAHDAIKTRGREIVARGFALMNDLLAGKGYVTGHFSIADAALFYVEFWADRIGIELPEHCAAHYRRLRERPVVQRVLAEEGYR